MLAETVEKAESLAKDSGPAETAHYASKLILESAIEGVDGQAPGLILTAHQIVNFRKYELAALGLPTALTDVIIYLGYEQGAGPGLEPGDFLNLFNSIRGHALGWNPLQREIKLTATDLKIFGDKMRRWEEAFVDLLDTVKVAQQKDPAAPKTLGELKSSNYHIDVERFKDLQVDLQSAAGVDKEIKTILEEIEADVKRQARSAADLRTRLVAYADNLNNKIQPSIHVKKELVLKRTQSEKAKVLLARIDERAAQIKSADNAYQAGVKNAIRQSFAGFGPLAGLFVGLKADKQRQRRNTLMKEQDADLALLAIEEKVQACLLVILYRFQQLEIVVRDASTCMENLVYVWSSIVLFAKDSEKSFEVIKDLNSLLTFRRRFISVCEPWVSVATQSHQLLDVFMQAEKIISQDYRV